MASSFTCLDGQLSRQVVTAEVVKVDRERAVAKLAKKRWQATTTWSQEVFVVSSTACGQPGGRPQQLGVNGGIDGTRRVEQIIKSNIFDDYIVRFGDK